jgi:hypothetical protein
MSGGNKRMNRYRIAALKPQLNGCVKLAACRVQFRDSYFSDFPSRLVLALIGWMPRPSAELILCFQTFRKCCPHLAKILAQLFAATQCFLRKWNDFSHAL